VLKRSITGAIFVIVLLGAVYYGSLSSFLLFLVIVLLGIEEFYSLVKKSKTVQPLKFYGTVTGTLLFIILALINQNIIDNKYLYGIVAALFFTFIIELYRKKNNPFQNIGYTLLGCIYVAIPFAMLYHLGFYNNNTFTNNFSYEIIIGFFIILWANDTGAYLSGKFFGKHKLFERISPKKTWEGSIGGGILAIGLAYLISHYYHNIDTVHWIIVSIIIVVFGGIGDLVESLLKRSLNIKDSGKILPGHGGILDRFDGLLISAPFVYCYLQMIS